jgi:dolichol-phosphate mannosyltransferase
MKPDLMVVMPVYNEEASIEAVVREWMSALLESDARFIFLILNDGSTDQTAAILANLKSDYGDALEFICRSNKGHGQTCVEGYRIALERDIPYILQIDSDGQSAPVHFHEMWSLRDGYDVIYGKRDRADGFRRVIASKVLRGALRILARVDCVDANVPYRLMNTRACAFAIQRIPDQIFLANIALAVLLRKNTAIRHGELPIRFPPRVGGEPSVPFRKFAAKAIELFVQLNKAGIR